MILLLISGGGGGGTLRGSFWWISVHRIRNDLVGLGFSCEVETKSFSSAKSQPQNPVTQSVSPFVFGKANMSLNCQIRPASIFEELITARKFGK